MKPVSQTVFGNDKGNCLAACFASVLEIPIEKVPNYIGYENWFEKFDNFVAEHGYRIFWYKMKKENEYEDILGFTAKNCYLIACGKSPRGDFDHCVIYKNGEMAHDPHPSNGGIENVKDIMILVKINPKSDQEQQNDSV